MTTSISLQKRYNKTELKKYYSAKVSHEGKTHYIGLYDNTPEGYLKAMEGCVDKIKQLLKK